MNLQILLLDVQSGGAQKKLDCLSRVNILLKQSNYFFVPLTLTCPTNDKINLMSAKILVVDDEQDLEYLIKQRFRKQIKEDEFTFLFAQNGVAALNMLKQNQDISIILTDINMPEMDGLTLLTHLPELNRLYKAVVVSAYGDLVNLRLAMNRGASDFITKPINFKELEVTIRKMMEQYAALSKARQDQQSSRALEAGLALAAGMQQSLIPNNFSTPYPNLKVNGKILPAANIGGDFFDFFKIDEKRIGFVIADVSGKGIPAALYMSMCKTLLHFVALKSQTAAETLVETNRFLALKAEKSESCMFARAFYAILDVETGGLSYCNAAHTPPYIIRQDQSVIKMQPQTGIPLGISDKNMELFHIGFSEEFFSLKNNDCLVLYTDGIIEGINSQGEVFGFNGLESSLRKNTIALLDNFIEMIFQDVNLFIGSIRPSDDMAVLCIKWKDPRENI